MSQTELNQTTTPVRSTDYQSERPLSGKIEQDFARIGLNPDMIMTRDSISAHLNNKAGKMIDRAILDELFEQVPTNYEDKILISDFIRIYSQAKDIIKSKIETCQTQITTYKRQRDECHRKAEDTKLTETYTQFGISQNSILSVIVSEARSLDFNMKSRGAFKVYTEVMFGNQPSVKTKTVSGREQHIWNEKFTFDVQDPNQLLKIQIRDQNKGDNGIKGEVIVFLNSLKDQNIQDNWFDLIDKKGTNNGEVHLKLQWIHSKVKYFTMMAQKWTENINQEEEDLKVLEKQFEMLHAPFYDSQSQEKKINFAKIQLELPGQTSSQNDLSIDIEQKITEGAPTHSMMDRQLSTMMHKFAFHLSKDTNPSLSYWKKLITFICVAEFIIGALMMFHRSSFIEVIVPVLILLKLHYEPLEDLINLQVVSFVLAGSIVTLDLVYLVLDFKGLFDGTNGLSGEIGLIMEILVGLFNMVLKLILAGLCYMTHTQTKKNKEVPLLNNSRKDAENLSYLQ